MKYLMIVAFFISSSVFALAAKAAGTKVAATASSKTARLSTSNKAPNMMSTSKVGKKSKALMKATSR